MKNPNAVSRTVARHSPDRSVPSQRTLAIAAMARMKGSWRSTKAMLGLRDKWLRTYPGEHQSEFQQAWQEVLENQDLISSVIDNYREDRQSITDLLGRLILEAEGTVEAKHRGAVFTPSWLARRVARSTFLHWRRLHRKGANPRVVADLSCGPGAFLHACQDIFGAVSEIVGSDCHTESVTYARLLSWALNARWDFRGSVE